MGIHGNVPQKGIEGLPLFSLEDVLCKERASNGVSGKVSQEQEVTKKLSSNTLNTVFFDPEILLNSSYNNHSRKEKDSKVYLLAVDTGDTVPTFRIKIEHSYEVETKHSYNRGFYTQGTSGPRETFTKREQKTETSYYMIKSTYWKRRPIIEVYNGQKRIGNQVSLNRASLSEIVSEISQVASERYVL